MTLMENVFRRTPLFILTLMLGLFAASPVASPLHAQPPAQAPAQHAGGEANLTIPDLSSVQFFGVAGTKLLLAGLVVCALGMLFGLMIYTRLKNMPVHESMREVS